jgi:hypothetical protein
MEASTQGRKFLSIIGRNPIILGLVISVIFIFNLLINWPLLAVTHMRGWRNFLDTFQVLMSVDCYAKVGFRIYQANPGDWCSNYVYGRTLIYLSNIFHLRSSLTNYIGVIVLVLIAFVIAYIFKTFLNPNLKNVMLLLVVVCSAPITLLVERANLDSIMFCLVVASIWFYKKSFIMTSFLLIVLASLLKFYTLPVLILFFLRKNTKIQVFVFSAFSLITTIVVLSDLTLASAIPIDSPNASFGSLMLGLLLKRVGLDLGIHISWILGLSLMFPMCLLLMFIRRHNSNFNSLFSTNLVSLSFDYEDVFALIFVSCYLFGLNYDYRLIFLVPALLPTLAKQKTNLGRRVFLLFILIIFWFSFDARIFQPIGDLFISVLCAYYLIELSYKINYKFKISFLIGLNL